MVSKTFHYQKCLNSLWFLILLVLFFSCKKEDPVTIPTTTLGALKEDEVATLPVIFHIIHRGEAVGSGGNISSTVIKQYLKSLNNDCRNTVKDANAVDIKIEFRLATKDPNGLTLAEAGIERISKPDYSPVSFENNAILMNTQWNPNNYINIWVVETLSSSGSINNVSWTNRFPVAPASNPIEGLTTISDAAANNYIPSSADGIVLANNVFNTDIIEDNGIVLTHEMGHFLGLFHVFVEGDGANCSNYSDYCSDTYKYDRFFYSQYGSSRLSRTTCSGTVVSADNVMDYSFLSSYRFTKNQMERMRKVLSYSPQRKVLRSSSAYYLSAVKDRFIIDTLGIFYPKQKPIQ